MVKYYPDLIQGSDEWHAARCGMLTASEMKLILTPKLKAADNDKQRSHLWELAAQRITRYVEPTYIGDDMLRGHEDEIIAREVYSEKFAPVTECGFVTNDKWGFMLGCSPDGLVGDDGMIEAKSRRQKFQIQTIIESHRHGKTPEDFAIQIQTELLVLERKWCDLISYSGGLPMATMRIFPDEMIQAAIVEASTTFEAQISEVIRDYRAALASNKKLIPTERRPAEQRMFV